MYCWSHGLNRTHKSCDCTWREPGHQMTATLDNMMGGKNTIARKKGERAIYKPPARPDRRNRHRNNDNDNNNNDNNNQA